MEPTEKRKHIRNGAIITLVLAGAAVWYNMTPDKAQLTLEDMQGQAPEIFEIRQENVPSIKIAPIIGWKAGETPAAAKGLAVNEFAAGLDHPRWLYQLPNGDVLVAEATSPARPTKGMGDRITRAVMKKANGSDKSANRITLLRDADGDGKAEFRSVLLDGLNSPTGMALLRDMLFIGNTDGVRYYPYKAGDTQITDKGKLLMKLPAGTPNNHWARNIIIDPKGENLYATVGSHGNIGEGGDFEAYHANKPERALIRYYNFKRQEQGIYAYGLRNPNGLAFNPQSGTLWTTVNERDMLGSDGPADYMTTVDFGTFYGWPFYFWGGIQDPRVQQSRPDLRQYTKRPDYALGPHVAALGIDFAKGAQLGDAWGRGAFVALHGSWNRSPASGYKVIYVPFNERGFPVDKIKPVDVLTGFLNDKGEAHGRPAGLIVDKSGALLVADDAGNRIWRVSKGG